MYPVECFANIVSRSYYCQYATMEVYSAHTATRTDYMHPLCSKLTQLDWFTIIPCTTLRAALDLHLMKNSSKHSKHEGMQESKLR